MLHDKAAVKGGQEQVTPLKNKGAILRNLLETQAQGFLTRCKFQGVTQMDSPSKFFFHLEKKNGQSKMIQSLRMENMMVLTDTTDIREFAVNFYTELYQSDVCNNISHHFYDDLPNIVAESRKDLVEALTLKKLHEALMSMNTGKSPGIDGLPVEFFLRLFGR